MYGSICFLRLMTARPVQYGAQWEKKAQNKIECNIFARNGTKLMNEHFFNVKIFEELNRSDLTHRTLFHVKLPKESNESGLIDRTLL